MRLLHNNPVLYREMRMRLRPSSLAMLAVAVGAILGLALIYILLQELDRRGQWARIDWIHVWHGFAVFVMVVQVFFAFYVALGSAANCIPREKNRNTYDFLTTLPISAVDKVIGLAVGINLYPLMVLVFLMPVAVAAGMTGGIPLNAMLWFYVLLGVSFLAVGLLGVAVGSGSGGGTAGLLIVLLFLLSGMTIFGVIEEHSFAATPLLAISPYATLKVLLSPPGECAEVFQPGQHHFFGWAIPWQVSPLSFLVFLGILSFAVARNKLSFPSNPPLDRRTVLTAFVVFQVMLLGFLSDALTAVEHPSQTAGTFFMINFCLVMAWGLAGQPTYAALMHWAGGRPHWIRRLAGESFTQIGSPTIFPAGAMWLVSVGAIVAMNRLYWREVSWIGILLVGIVLGVFLLAYQSLYTAGCLALRRRGKVLGLVLVAACFTIPSIFSTLQHGERVLHATPLAVFGQFFSWNSPLLNDGQAVSKDFNYFASLSFAVGELLVFGGVCLVALNRLARRAPRAEASLPPLPAA
jgi:hypothetical protein